MNNQKKATIATAFVLLASQMMVGNGAKAANQLVSSYAIHDGYWDDLGYNLDSDKNYVGVDVLGEQKAALQFDLNHLSNHSFVRAKLKIFVTDIYRDEQSHVAPIVTLYGSSSTDWDESAFPTYDSPVQNPSYINDVVLTKDVWKEFDVTGYIQDQLETGRTTITFAFISSQPAPASFGYAADEGESDKAHYPRLEFEYAPSPLHAPSVTDSSTVEDQQVGLGNSILPFTGEEADVAYYQISGIHGGTLYKNDAATLIGEGSYITREEAENDLKFTPDRDANNLAGDTFGFTVKAARDSDGSGLSEGVPVTISVSEVNDPPEAFDDALTPVEKNSGVRTIPFSTLLGNDKKGPDNESNQTLTITSVDQSIGGVVQIDAANENVLFTPNADYSGPASFAYTVEDNGTTNGSDHFLTASARANFDVQATEKPVIQLSGSEDVYVLVGQDYEEPGFSAVDKEQQDLTPYVSVTDTVDKAHPGTYTLHYNVSDHTGNAAAEVTRRVHVVSTDLASLSIHAGALNPAYDPATSTYTLTVPSSVDSLSVAASTVDSTATITVDGTPRNSGEATSVDVRTGRNEYVIVVTARGGATHMYSLVVTRQAASVPTPSPGNSTSIPEQQHQLNDRAREAIQESTDGKWIREQVEKALDHLSDVVEPSDVDDATKLDLVASTVTDVFEPLLDKWEQGVITRSQLNALLGTFLEDGLNKVMDHVDLADQQVFQIGTETVSALIEEVVSKLDDDQVKGEVADQLGNVMNRLLETKNAIIVHNHGEVDGIRDQLKQIDAMIKSWSEGLGGKARLFDLERQLIVRVDDESAAKSMRATEAKTVSAPTVRFQKDTMKELGEKGFVVTVINEEGASVKLPASFFAEHKRDDLAVTVEADKEATIPSSYAKASHAYAFKILAGDKEITRLGKDTVLISIPYAYKSSSLTPYYYDAKRKTWKQVTATRSQPLEIKKSGDLMQFSTASLQTYMLAETGLRSLSVDQRSLKLEPGASQQLKVMGSLSGGRKVDLSAEEDGTVYTSSKPDLVSVDENGLIRASSDAKSGTKATITVKNGKRTAKVTVTVYTLNRLAIYPASASVTAGQTLQLKVYALYSDRSRVDVSKASAGTTYSLEEHAFASISDDGLLTIREDAPDGAQVSIHVTNDEVSQTYTVKVKNR